MYNPRLPTLFIIFIQLLIQSHALAQHPGLQLYTVADGLVQSEVVAIHQDKKGFLWIGTKNGISRFDGREFQTIADSNQVSRSITLFMADMDDSSVAIITGKGYILYEYGKYSSRITSGIKDQGFYAGFWIWDQKLQFVINSDSKGTLYELDRQGLRKTDALFMHLAEKEFFPESNICFHIAPRDGKIYFINKTGKLCCISHNRLVEMPVYPNNYFFTDSDGYLFCLTPDERKRRSNVHSPARQYLNAKNQGAEPVLLYKISDTAVELVHNFGHDYKVLSNLFLYDDKDHFLITNYGDQEIRITSDDITTSYRFGLNLTATIFRDRDGNYWLGSALGLVRSFPLCFANYTEKEGLFPNGQFVAEDKLGNIVTGSYEKGFQVLSNGRFKHVPLPKTGDISAPMVIYPGGGKDRFGNVLVCMDPYTALRWDGLRFSRYPGFPSSAALCFYEDIPSRTDYLGTTIGLITKPWDKPVTWASVYPGNKTNKIVSIIADGKGRIILGGFHGITIKAGGTLRPLPDQEFPFSKGANTMVKDLWANVWIGNNDGLYFFDNTKFTKVQNPYFNDLVVSLCLVDSSTLFIGGLRGIGLLDLKRFYHDGSVNIRYFDRDNGFFGNECQQNAVTLDRNGMVWFATTNSLVRLDPKKIPGSGKGPVIYITGVSVIDHEMHQKPVIRTCTDHADLKLSYQETKLRFEFTALFYLAPSHVRYRYMLEGHETGWTEPNADRFAVYMNLKPGKYTFKVIACNDEGMWSEKPAMITIHIKPAFWQTWWFLVIAILMGASIVFWSSWLIFRRTRQRKQKELEQKRMLTELQFKTLKNQLAPHFIFNALNAVGSSIYRNDPKGSYDLLHKFSRLIRHTLTYADKTSRTLAEEVEFVQYYLEIEQIRFDGRISFEIQISPDVPLETMVPRMILQTFVENAVKHGLMHKEAPGCIRIHIIMEGNTLVMNIADDGIGREAARQFRGESTGKGMEIIREFIRLFNEFNQESITVEISDLKSETGEAHGTGVLIRIPCIYSYTLTHEDKLTENVHH